MYWHCCISSEVTRKCALWCSDSDSSDRILAHIFRMMWEHVCMVNEVANFFVEPSSLSLSLSIRPSCKVTQLKSHENVQTCAQMLFIKSCPTTQDLARKVTPWTRAHSRVSALASNPRTPHYSR